MVVTNLRTLCNSICSTWKTTCLASSGSALGSCPGLCSLCTKLWISDWWWEDAHCTIIEAGSWPWPSNPSPNLFSPSWRFARYRWCQWIEAARNRFDISVSQSRWMLHSEDQGFSATVFGWTADPLCGTGWWWLALVALEQLQQACARCVLSWLYLFPAFRCCVPIHKAL